MRLHLIIFFLMATSCATKNSSEYQLFAYNSKPDIWQPDSIWNIVMLDKKGHMVRNITLKFTDDIAETCSAGDFKKVEILSERPKRNELFMGEPAYEIRGNALIIDLTANLCDAGYELSGQFSDIGVEGMHGGDKGYRFYGSPALKGS